MPNEKPILISIVGPTAAGKSALALTLAFHYHTHIISCDSRQLYRYLDIGTAKPDAESLALVPHHFIDIRNPDETFNAGAFEREAKTLLLDLFQSHDVIIAVGGSTLYFQALWQGIDPMPPADLHIRQHLQDIYQQKGLSPLLQQLKEADFTTYEQIDHHNHARVIRALEVYLSSGIPISNYRKGHNRPALPYQQLKIGLYKERAILYEKINHRVDQMIDKGLVQEVQQILNWGYAPTLQALQSIGYQEVISFIQGDIELEEAIRLIKRNSRRYAKRQMTYYKRFSDIHWFDVDTVSQDQILRWVHTYRTQQD